MVRGAIGGHLLAEDLERLFDFDISTIPANDLDDYLLSLGNVSGKKFETMISSAKKNKIFIEKKTLKALGGTSYKPHYRKMVQFMRKDPNAWVVNNPFPLEVRDRCDDSYVSKLPINILPYLPFTIGYAYEHSGYVFNDILRAYIRAYKPICEVPVEYRSLETDDETLGLYCICLRRGLSIHGMNDSRFVIRLIRTMGTGRVYKQLRTHNYDACEMYIMAYSEDGTIDGASDALIAKAYRLARVRE